MDKQNVYTHNGIPLNIKRYEILIFTTTWMDLENVTLSEISQSHEDKCMISHI